MKHARTITAKLAGYNVDHDLILELKSIEDVYNRTGKINPEALFKITKEGLTPETISAAYARISRDPAPIAELRKNAREDIKKARASNKAIIFGVGHSSIAEHVVLNFDIENVSRFLVETIEKKRYGVGYTEKSQRYITLKGDYTTPAEITEKIMKDTYHNLIAKQIDFYNKNLPVLQEWHFAQDNEAMLKGMKVSEDRAKGVIEGWGKEDARYSLAMATHAQIGMTISARNIEKLITELASSHLAEARELASQLTVEVKGVAPSVIKYTDSTDYFTKTRPELAEVVNEIAQKYGVVNEDKSDARVRFHEGLNREHSIPAGLMFSSSDLSYGECLNLTKKMNSKDRSEIVKASFRYKEAHDPMLREFELGDRVIEMVMSSSAFAQMKRHRPNTLITQDYNPALNVTIPESISGAGKTDEFMEVIEESNIFYDILRVSNDTRPAANCILSNAHRRRLVLDANNRQLHAIAMERQNLFAQWDIRATVDILINEAKKRNPIAMMLACGKHEYADVKKRLMDA